MEPTLIATLSEFRTTYVDLPDGAMVWETHYMSDPDVVALVVTDETSGYPPAIDCTATVYLPTYRPEAGHVLIKDYGENEGVREALEKAGVIGPVLATHTAGWAEVTEHELLAGRHG